MSPMLDSLRDRLARAEARLAYCRLWGPNSEVEDDAHDMNEEAAELVAEIAKLRADIQATRANVQRSRTGEG